MKRYLLAMSMSLFLVFTIIGCNKQIGNNNPHHTTVDNLTDEYSNNKNNILQSTDEIETIPVIVNDFLIGGFSEGKWVQKENILPKIKGGETYRLYSTSQYSGTAIGGKPEFDEFGDYYIEMESVESFGTYSIAIGSNSELIFQKPIEKEEIFYKDIISNFFNEIGLTGYQVKILQGVSFDLDRDGIEEHIISLNNYNNSDIIRGGWYDDDNYYSFLVISKTVKDELIITIINEAARIKADAEMAKYLQVEKDTDLIFRSEYYVMGAIDINSDGILEVICREEVLEGISYSVYEYKNGILEKVLEAGYGR